MCLMRRLLVQLFMKYYKSLDGWPVAIGDYWLANIMSYMDQPEGYELMELVDPFSKYMNILYTIIVN